MFMTQNASVEAVAARTHRTERNGFMLRAREGVFDKILTAKSVLQVRDRS